MDRPTASTQHGLYKRLLPLAGVLLLCLLASTALLYYSAKSSAEEEARDYGESLGRATAILIQPLLLADDRISLNYVFNELNKQPQLNGLHLVDGTALPVAVAGSQTGLRQTLELSRDSERLGELTLWINPQYSWMLLKNLLFEAGALALGSILLTLLTLWFVLRRSTSPAAAETSDFRTLASDIAPQFDDELETEDEHPAPVPTLDSEQQIQVREDEYEFDDIPGDALDEEPEDLDDAPLSFDSDPDEHEREQQTPLMARQPSADFEPQLASWLSPNAGTRDSSDETGYSAAPARPAAETNTDSQGDTGRDDNRELVELLRPSRDRQGMPPFTPQDHRDEESDEAIAPDIDDDQVEFDDSAQETQPKSRFSVVQPLGRKEEQLGLYTLEHELELMLQAKDAGYLFLIDATSARSENITEEERQHLLRPYRTLANSVAHIYSGRVEAGSDGDLQLFFDQPKEDDSHGINALCSAMLFSYLYRHYNQHRIRQFKPVINLHLALVRGKYDRLDRMQEEAHFLTRTTESNELISHTALTEAADLKATLLAGADIRREDEDKVLIMKIAKSYQELLEKQARHLLTKLQSREQEQARD
ncbi:hypothetical protein [Marinobacterium lutimaris]|uniref:Uncharacterized protein n=1 Tax=Marinobacterium lutimaris TaxID=568106 RepID=A0A1H6CVC7_9GAMM|nr:hypothetical protein [Marinobacterium lutimaris]SEG76643.1 hypothetical protein SAMN05444390_104172 [Marinobacterium lutimaris]